MTANEQLVIRLLSDEGCGYLQKSELTLDSTFHAVGLDSLKYLEFIVLLEEALGGELPDSFLAFTLEQTIGDFLQLMRASGVGYGH